MKQQHVRYVTRVKRGLRSLPECGLSVQREVSSFLAGPCRELCLWQLQQVVASLAVQKKYLIVYWIQPVGMLITRILHLQSETKASK